MFWILLGIIYSVSIVLIAWPNPRYENVTRKPPEKH